MMTATTAMTAAGLYVGLNLLILLVLGVMVMRQRQATKIGVGDGGQEKLIQGSTKISLPLIVIVFGLL